MFCSLSTNCTFHRKNSCPALVPFAQLSHYITLLSYSESSLITVEDYLVIDYLQILILALSPFLCFLVLFCILSFFLCFSLCYDVFLGACVHAWNREAPWKSKWPILLPCPHDILASTCYPASLNIFSIIQTPGQGHRSGNLGSGLAPVVNISHFLNLVRALAAAEDKRFPHHSVYSEFILSWLGLAPQTAEENRPEKDFYHLSSFWFWSRGWDVLRKCI